MSTPELFQDIHGRYKARAVMALDLDNNNDFFQWETVKGINTAFSIHTPTLNVRLTKLIMQLRLSMFMLQIDCNLNAALQAEDMKTQIQHWNRLQRDKLPLFLCSSFPDQQCYHILRCFGCEIR